MDNKNFGLGAIESPIDLRDYTYDMLTMATAPVEIPYQFILDYQYDILNQGLVGSCVPHGLSEMRNYIDGVPYDDTYSVGFIYANREESDSQGVGMITRQALKNLVKYGDCKKKSFPVNEEYPAILNTLKKYGKDELLAEASQYKSLAYLKLNTNEIKEYLVKYKKPIAITVYVYDNFYNACDNGGKIPSTPSGNKRGSHLMIIIGYIGNTLVLVNSWGEYSGDKGRYYLDINSEIIKELWCLEDELNLTRPIKITYTVGWNKVVVNGVTKWTYSNDGKTLLKSTWIQVGGEYYYIGANTYALDGEWINDGGWYYLEKDSCKLLSGWFKVNGCWYYGNPNHDGTFGKMQTGWLKYNDYWYYLEPQSGKNQGHMYCSETVNINGKFYEFDASGRMIKEY